MKRYDVVSLDLFQTLVNVDSRLEQVWRPILKDGYTMGEAKRHSGLRLEKFFKHWTLSRESETFVLMRRVFRDSMEEHFLEQGIEFDCGEATELLISEHTHSQAYEETEEFLARLTREYKVCILSDADDDMVPDILKRYPLELVTSEQLRSYKNDRTNAMFRHLLELHSADPSRVIHVGDSVSDVAGAHREGIVSCWLNRDGKKWTQPVRPDYEIRHLNELWPLLEDVKYML